MIIVYIVHNKEQEPIGDLCATPEARSVHEWLAIAYSGCDFR